MILALCEGPIERPISGDILNPRWLWHPDHRPKGDGPYVVPVIHFRNDDGSTHFYPTIRRMEGNERPENETVLFFLDNRQQGFDAVLREIAKVFKRILEDPEKSADRFDFWMKTKEPMFAPERFDQRAIAVALTLNGLIKAGQNKRRERVDYLRTLFRSNGIVNEDQLRKLERKLGLQ